MPVEFRLQNIRQLRKFHRIIYTFLLMLIMFSAFFSLLKNIIQVVYFCIAFIVFWITDEILFYENNHINSMAYQLRCLVYTLILLAGCFMRELPVAIFFPILIFEFLILSEEVFLCDVFDDFINYLMIGLTSCLFVIGSIMSNITKIDASWVFMLIVIGIIVVLIIFRICKFYIDSIRNITDRYTKLYFSNTDTIDENNKLRSFQEKVEKVNSEINYQKISLTKANDELKKNNLETRSLIEVMKYFSANFNVPKNAERMIENVMEIKKTGMCGFYMEKDTYMNESPYLKILSTNQELKTIIEQDIEDIFRMIKQRKLPDPLVICHNHDFKYPYLAGADVVNAVAIPAFENDKIYGVMVVTSASYDFFEGGFAFYESSLMDFTSALISDCLYLKTEEMAKRDGLTKIYNRIYFNHFYPDLCKRVEQEKALLSVAMMDIDHFKIVNDTYGHLAGDEVIKMVAHTADDFAKKYGGVAVRFGGEEFLLILPDFSLDKAYMIIQEMHDKIAHTIISYENLKININTSMGIASYPETSNNVLDVLEHSDSAMYYSKEHGRAQITIYGNEGEK